jgi:N-acetylglutamate synthase-like GNAT family acetyltransferase
MVRVRAAQPTDLTEVEALLSQAGLPLEGVGEAFAHFFVAEVGGRIVAAGGVEPYRPFGLLRSTVVDPEYRGLGLGATLVRHLLDDARGRGLSKVYLLTTTAPEYFAGLGFRPVKRAAVPLAVRQSAEFREVCPVSAVAMQMNLGAV